MRFTFALSFAAAFLLCSTGAFASEPADSSLNHPAMDGASSGVYSYEWRDGYCAAVNQAGRARGEVRDALCRYASTEGQRPAPAETGAMAELNHPAPDETADVYRFQWVDGYCARFNAVGTNRGEVRDWFCSRK